MMIQLKIEIMGKCIESGIFHKLQNTLKRNIFYDVDEKIDETAAGLLQK